MNKKLLFVLGKDDIESATRCFLFAKIAHQSGMDVQLFLIDGGVHWAHAERDGSEPCETGDCPQDNLPYLIDNNIPCGVCVPCAEARGVTEEHFYPNMRMARGPELMNMITTSQVFNF